METLHNQYLALATEYVRQFCEITNAQFEQWVGPREGFTAIVARDDSQSAMTFSIRDIMMVVDNREKLTDRYGSIEAVGHEIVDWYNYITDDGTPDRMISINLYSWLHGLPTRKDSLRPSPSSFNEALQRLRRKEVE